MPLVMYDNPGTFDADLSGAIVDEQSYISIVNHFKYLGSFISRGIIDDRGIDTRILKAGNAFGSIRKLFGSQYMHDSVKGSVCGLVILSILLYGAKCWCLTEWLLQKLCSFCNRCVQAMHCVNRMQTCLFQITTSELLQRLSLSSVDAYVSQQQLCWAGHVICMPWDYLPRKMISSWVCSKRLKGCPNLTFG